MRLILICVMCCAALLACGSGDDSDQATTTDTLSDEATEAVATLADAAVEPATRKVSCGCAVESVGQCGNYIEVGTQFVEIANGEDLGLGGMEWCGKSGVEAEASGEIKDGKFVATTLAVK